MSRKLWEQENLRKGERYAGVIQGIGRAPDSHIILLPGESAPITWGAAIRWASSIGGELPSVRELHLLAANLDSSFEDTWYWSSQESDYDANYAWCFYFKLGGQYVNPKTATCSARAIRRVKV